MEGVRSFITKLSEFIFPIFCLGCDMEGKWLCDVCFATVRWKGVYCCPVCHKPRAHGSVCDVCVPNSFLSAHIALTQYQEEGLIGDIVRHIKYHYIEELLSLLETVVGQILKDQAIYVADIEAVVPVPLHKKRFAERGFNQAELIAMMVAEHIEKPVLKELTRVRATPHQAKLGREERIVNVRDAFFMKPTTHQVILLVDDVYTTGTTMQEAAKALLQAGVREVRGFSLARG